jgi:hypothetical protein
LYALHYVDHNLNAEISCLKVEGVMCKAGRVRETRTIQMLLLLEYVIVQSSFNGPDIETIGIDIHLSMVVNAKDNFPLDISIYVSYQSL